MFESIEYNPFRYIRKNRIEKELMPCLKAAYQRLEEMQDSYMIVKTEEAEVRVNHSDIMYYETTARKIGIHLKNGEVLLVRKTIKELYKELNDEHFTKFIVAVLQMLNILVNIRIMILHWIMESS